MEAGDSDEIEDRAVKDVSGSQAKKDGVASDDHITLFVRNIGFETTELKFKEFMEKFGEVNYAVLCKQSNRIGEGDDATPAAINHRGTGFVQFKNRDAAIQVLELS